MQLYGIKPCKVLDIGCGMGNYSVFLATRGFEVTGIDSSAIAISHARKLALGRNVKPEFIADDFLSWGSRVNVDFSFIFDWEVLHHIYPEQRPEYLDNVARLLDQDGIYFSVCFHEDDTNFGGKGKYRTTSINTRLYFSSLEELRALYEPRFRILELKTTDIPGKIVSHVGCLAVLKQYL